jgi:mercuric reductase
VTASGKVPDAIARLQTQLPLQSRQARLSEPVRQAHCAILQALAERGEPPTDDELAAIVGADRVADVIRELGDADLVVLDADRARVVGAYPMTTEPTPHRLALNGTAVNAMCALDALAVAPMYHCQATITSRCGVTGEPIYIEQQDERIQLAEPSADVRVGVKWQNPEGHAAHSMCLEMVFLADGPTSELWAKEDPEARTTFTLDEAVAFGAGFFRPIVG